LVVRGSLREFFAWTSTFGGSTLFPITAFADVVSADDERALSGVVAFNFERDGKKVAEYVGVILADGLRSAGWNPELLTVSACMSTYAYAMSRNVMAGYPLAPKELERRWSRICRWSSGVDVESPASQALPLICLVAAESDRGEKLCSDVENALGFLEDCRRFGDVSELRWRETTSELAELRSGWSIMKAGVEERFLFLRASLPVIASMPGLRAGMLAGYLVSGLGPEFLVHSELLSTINESVPGAVYWYGLFSGVRSGPGVLDAQRGLGWHLARRLLTSPECKGNAADIAYDELEALVDNAAPYWAFNRSVSTQVFVEIGPGVVVPFRIAKEHLEKGPRGTQGAKDDLRAGKSREGSRQRNFRESYLYSDVLREMRVTAERMLSLVDSLEEPKGGKRR
jgi:hypothetical protein